MGMGKIAKQNEGQRLAEYSMNRNRNKRVVRGETGKKEKPA